MTAEQLRIKTKPLETFSLEPEQRDVLLLIPSLSKTIKNKLMKEKPVTVAEVASITMSLAGDLPDGEPQNQVALLMVAGHLMDQLEEGIMAKAEQLENLEADSGSGLHTRQTARTHPGRNGLDQLAPASVRDQGGTVWCP